MATPLSAPVANNSTRTLLGIIQSLGLTTGLNVVLDAGDTRSYDGSSQTWTDASGNGNSFFLGADGSAGASDPTFNGTAGVADASTYFSFDGGDYFTETTAQTFAADWHKDGGICSIFSIVYPTTGSILPIWYNTVQSGEDGCRLIVSNLTLNWAHATSNALVQSTNSGGSTCNTGAWNAVGFIMDEPVPSQTFYCNGNTNSPSLTVSTCTDNNQTVNRIGAYGDLTTIASSGQRVACFAAWSTNVGTSAFDRIYERLRARRFPTLP